MLFRLTFLLFGLALLTMVLAKMLLPAFSAPLPSYVYIINSRDDFSARDVQLYDPNTGISLNLLHRPTRFSELTLAPDGHQFAFVESFLGIYRSDSWGTSPERLVTGYVGNPLWSPTGNYLLYGDDENLNLLDLSTLEQRTLMPLQVGATWLPDGEHIAYSEFNPETRLYDIRILSLLDDSVTTLHSSPDLIVYIAFSPDTSWLAYSVLTGQIVLRELATDHEIILQDDANHFAPQWSETGEYLLFIRTFPRQTKIDIAIANRSGEIIYTHAPKGLTLESSVLWWPD